MAAWQLIELLYVLAVTLIRLHQKLAQQRMVYRLAAVVYNEVALGHIGLIATIIYQNLVPGLAAVCRAGPGTMFW